MFQVFHLVCVVQMQVGLPSSLHISLEMGSLFIFSDLLI